MVKKIKLNVIYSINTFQKPCTTALESLLRASSIQKFIALSNKRSSSSRKVELGAFSPSDVLEVVRAAAAAGEAEELVVAGEEAVVVVSEEELAVAGEEAGVVASEEELAVAMVL